MYQGSRIPCLWMTPLCHISCMTMMFALIGLMLGRMSMAYDRNTITFADDFPSRRRLLADKDYLIAHHPEMIYTFCYGSIRLMIRRNFVINPIDSGTYTRRYTSYSVFGIGFPPQIGIERSLMNAADIEPCIDYYRYLVRQVCDGIYVSEI